MPIVVDEQGLRRGELLALRWRHVDFERQCLKICEALEEAAKTGIRVKAPKSASSNRTLPISPELVAALQAYRPQDAQPDDWLFHEAGVPWTPTVFSKQFAKIAQSAGVGGFRLHDLRHAFASLVLQQGTSVKEVSSLLGHSRCSRSRPTPTPLKE